ncbi:hypothetical protein CI102_4473 [Trichoderma harzianum]|nr:hypothetical protein CI102_4473 [Trichoderma harzianum]
MNLLFGRKPGNNFAVSLVFDDVLDPEKLRESLEGLVKREGWQRLGGRLRKNAAGEIEWHIPAEFTADRPAIAFAHIDHGMSAASHPAASKIPQPSTRPAVLGDPDNLADLAWEAGYQPGGISDYLTSDRPVLGLRVNSFTDKTIVVLQNAVRRGSWSSMLWGKTDQIPTPCGFDTDPFDAMAKDSRPITEQHVLSDKRVGFGGLLQWGLGYGVDMLVRTKENRMVCIPETYWRVQLDKALEELCAEAIAKGEDASKVFLTENDILTAWTIRCIVSSTEMNSDRTVATSIAMSLRKAFEGDLIPPSAEHPYVGNAYGWANVLVKAGDVSSKPLSWLALQVRRAINEQGTREQHEAYHDMVRTSYSGLPVIVFGDGTMAQIGFSNWSKAGLFDLDFAPARKTLKGDVPCRPSYVQENHGPIKPADGWFIFGKDEKGNYWSSACRVKGQWAKFQAQIDDDFKDT